MLKYMLTTKYSILIYQDFVRLPKVYKVYDFLKWKRIKIVVL
jgi:hypothetical protein